MLLLVSCLLQLEVNYHRGSTVGLYMQEAADLLAGIDELDAAALGAALTQHGVKAPETWNAVSVPFAFNLMFKTSIGPKGDLTGYLRPETAQGIFVNFRCANAVLYVRFALLSLPEDAVPALTFFMSGLIPE